MKLPRYPKYKSTGMKWLNDVPEHWDLGKLKRLASIRYGIGEPPVYRFDGTPLIRATDIRSGKITPDGIVFVDPMDIPAKRILWLQPDDIIVVRSGAYTGDSAIIPLELTPSIAGFDMVLRPHKCFPQFLQYALLSDYMKSAQIDLERLRAAQPHLNAEELGSCVTLIPTEAEQRDIANFLDHETEKIDALLDEQKIFIELLNEKVTALVLSSISSTKTGDIRLNAAAQIIKRPVAQREDEIYIPIGLYNRGRGIFHKDPREMDEMGDSNFFWIEEGDLIISGQFAWEGSVALAGSEDTGCVVSHRYPVLRGIPGTSLTEYLLALLMTKHGDFLLNENSRGAAGRNRPLNINSLLKEKVPIPDMQTQEKIAKAVHWRRKMLGEMSRQVEFLEERRSALITAAVTGQIDVRNYRSQEAPAICQ